MHPDQFEIIEGVAEAIGQLSQLFGRVVIVTNQQGIGKELMTHSDLNAIHDKMIELLTWSGGQIDEVYYCPDLEWEDSINRKPNPGMAYQAKADFPEIEFKKSIMIGDSESDVAFGKSVGMKTVRISKGIDHFADYTHPSLADFVLYLSQ